MPSLFTSLFHRSEKRRAYTELMRLDDHLLRDIGVTRSDVRDLMSGRNRHAGKYRSHE